MFMILHCLHTRIKLNPCWHGPPLVLYYNCRSQCLLDRLRRCTKLFVSTDSTSSHEFASEFGLAIFIRENIQQLSRRPSLAQVSVKWTSVRAVETERNAGHGLSIAIDDMSGNNSDHSGDRFSQNGEKKQVKTATRRVYTFTAWKNVV